MHLHDHVTGILPVFGCRTCGSLFLQGGYLLENFNKMRTRAYLEDIVIGVAATLIGLEIVYSIVYEMMTAYLETAYFAYITGLVLAGLISLAGIFFILRAVGINKRLFGKLTIEEKHQFFEQLKDQNTLIFDNHLIISQHYILVFARSLKGSVHLIHMTDLIACFGREVYGSKKLPESYQLILFDNNFRRYICTVKGEKAPIMTKAYEAVLSLSPWVFSDNLDVFMDTYSRKSKEKAMLKEIELRRRETEPTDDTLPVAMITAADIIRAYNEKQKTKPSLNLKEGAKSIFHKKEEDETHKPS